MEPEVEPVGEFTRDEFGGVDDGLPGGNAAAHAVPEGVWEEEPIGHAEVDVCSEGDEVEGAVAEGLEGARDVGEGRTEGVSAGVNGPVDGEGREPGEVAGTPSEGLGGKFEVAGSGADGVGSVDVPLPPASRRGFLQVLVRSMCCWTSASGTRRLGISTASGRCSAVSGRGSRVAMVGELVVFEALDRIPCWGVPGVLGCWTRAGRLLFAPARRLGAGPPVWRLGRAKRVAAKWW